MAVKQSMTEMIMAEAKAELTKELRAKYVGRIKDKMKQLSQAKQLVKNCEREIADLEMVINDEMS